MGKQRKSENSMNFDENGEIIPDPHGDELMAFHDAFKSHKDQASMMKTQ